MSTFTGEFIGTALLILLGNGVVANAVLKRSKGNGAGWISITAGWGLGVAFAVLAVNHVSGAHLNPAVTAAMLTLGKISLSSALGYWVAQVLGAMLGATLVWLSYLPHWRETKDVEGKLACFATGPAIRHTVGNLMTEAMGTAVLVFGVLMIGRLGELMKEGGAEVGLGALFGTVLAPLLVGLLVFSIGLSLGGPTGYAINPARDLGPRLAHSLLPIEGKGGSDWGYSWIPIVGPLVGGILGAWVYSMSGL